jgi:hypothetical protein
MDEEFTESMPDSHVQQIFVIISPTPFTTAEHRLLSFVSDSANPKSNPCISFEEWL